jgi:hypothetical protein
LEKPACLRNTIRNRPLVTVLFRLENSRKNVCRGGDASIREMGWQRESVREESRAGVREGDFLVCLGIRFSIKTMTVYKMDIRFGDSPSMDFLFLFLPQKRGGCNLLGKFHP